LPGQVDEGQTEDVDHCPTHSDVYVCLKGNRLAEAFSTCKA